MTRNHSIMGKQRQGLFFKFYNNHDLELILRISKAKFYLTENSQNQSDPKLSSRRFFF